MIAATGHHPSCALLHLGGTRAGISSAAMPGLGGDWPALTVAVRGFNPLVCELNAESVTQMAALAAHLSRRPAPAALWVGVRAPSGADEAERREVARLLGLALAQIGPAGYAIVEADAIGDPEPWRALGGRVCITHAPHSACREGRCESQGTRGALPGAGVCLELALGPDADIDQMRACMSRIRGGVRVLRLALSSSRAGARALMAADLSRARSLLGECPDVPWIATEIDGRAGVIRRAA